MKPNNEKLAKIVKKAKSESLKNIENAKAEIKPILKKISNEIFKIQEILEKYNCYSDEVEGFVEKISELDNALFDFDLNDDIKNIQTKWDLDIPFGQ